MENQFKRRKLIDFEFIEEINTQSSEMPIQSQNIEESNYNILTKKYKDSEFIPYEYILEVIKHYFPSSNIIHVYDENHFIIKIKLYDILGEHVEMWCHNRQADSVRIVEIQRYLQNNKHQAIDTMFYLTYNNITKKFGLLDGVHRQAAYKLIVDEYNKRTQENQQDFNSNLPNINLDISWLTNKDIILNIRFNYTSEQLLEVFRVYHKSQPVPLVYQQLNTSPEKLDMIKSIANEWQLKYRSHFSPSNNPNIGNTNRNKFEELLTIIYNKHKISRTGINEFKQILEELNMKISQNIPKKATASVRAKCMETGCYLFLYKNEQLDDFI
jgi:hypothetical protein